MEMFSHNVGRYQIHYPNGGCISLGLFMEGRYLLQIFLSINLVYHEEFFGHLTLYQTIPTFNDLEQEDFRKHCEKKERMLVTRCFLLFQNMISIFSFMFILSSANTFNLDQSKTLSFGKEINPIFMDEG